MNKFSFISKILKSGSKSVVFIFGMLLGALITSVSCGCDLTKALNVENFDNFFVQESKCLNDSNSKSEKKNSEGKMVVSRVIDGDTLVLGSGEKVRLLGIDTPERGEFYYKEATERLRELVDKKEIIMTKDVSQRDRYGRLLRNIYLGDVWINAKMIREGYARFVVYPPDVSHVEKFRELEKEAKKEKLGIWSKNSSKKN